MSKLIKEALAKALVNVPKKRELYPLIIMSVLLMAGGFFAFQTTATTVEDTMIEEQSIVENQQQSIEEPTSGSSYATLEDEYKIFLESNPDIEQSKPSGDNQLLTVIPEEECSEGEHMSYTWIDGYYTGHWWNFIWQEGYWQNNGCVADMEPTETPQCSVIEEYQGTWIPAEYDYVCTDWSLRRFGHHNWQWVCVEGQEIITGGEWDGQCVAVYECYDGNKINGDGCDANNELEDTYSCREVIGQSGWFGTYYNYSRDHEDMNLPGNQWPDDGHGDPLGSWDTDWYSNDYFKFNRVDSDLTFGEDFFPFDIAPEEIDNGHEYHFGAHWRAQIIGSADPVEWAETSTNVFDAYDFTLTSDDDSWIYVDGVLVYDNSGIHAPATINGSLSLYGTHTVDIFFAERHTTRSHMYFVFDNPEYVTITPMPERCEELEPDTGSICGLKFNDLDYNSKYNGKDYPMSKWQIDLYGNQSSDEGDEWADEVVSNYTGEYYFHFTEGVSPEQQTLIINSTNNMYNNPNKSLGVATGYSPTNAYGIGGGELILGFDNIISNEAGDDLQLYTLNYYGETQEPLYLPCVDVYASTDQSSWELLGNNCSDGDYAFDLGSLSWAKYVKLVDTSDLEYLGSLLPQDINFTVTGFMVDAVKALHSYDFSGEPSQTEITTEEGYCFADLKPGFYKVCEVMQEGWENSTPLCQSVWVDAGETVDINFGNHLTFPTGTYEVSKTLLTEGDIHPGDVVDFNLTVENTGLVDIPTLDIRDIFTSAALNFSSASVMPTTSNTSSLVWLNGLDEDGILNVGDTWSIEVSFIVDSEAVIGSYGNNRILVNNIEDDYGHQLPIKHQSVWFQVIAPNEEPQPPNGGGGGGGGLLGPITFNNGPIPQVLGEQEFADCTEIGGYPAGSLIAQQGVKDATVYYISQDCQRYFFPDPKTYFTWYENWSPVHKVDLQGLTAYANSGVAITYRPGTKLVTHMQTPNIYAVEPQGKLRLIPSMEIGESLFGANWLNKVQDVIVSFFNSSYTVTSNDMLDTLPTGTLAKDSASGDEVYYIENGNKRLFTGNWFTQNNYQSKYITTANLSTYGLGADINSYEYNLADTLEGRDR